MTYIPPGPYQEVFTHAPTHTHTQMSLDINEKDFFGPPPPPRSLDPLNPNPLCSLADLYHAEHFRLMSRGSVEEIRLLGCQIIQSGTRMLRM